MAKAMDRVIGLAMLWMILAIPLAALDWQTALVVATILLLGPFAVVAVTFILGFIFSVVIWGEPDRLIEKWF